MMIESISLNNAIPADLGLLRLQNSRVKEIEVLLYLRDKNLYPCFIAELIKGTSLGVY